MILESIRIYRLLILVAVFLLNGAFFQTFEFSTASAQSKSLIVPSKVKNFRLGLHKDKTRIVIDIDGTVDYSYFSLPDPYRLVLDMSEVIFQIPRKAIRQSSGQIRGYRFGLFEPGISRVVIDLTRPMIITKTFIITPGLNPYSRLVIDLKKVPRAEFLEVSTKSSIRRQQKGFKQTPERKNTIANERWGKTNVESGNTFKKTIVIDPGHGGVDPGAIGLSGSYEKNVVLMAAKTLKRVLTKTGRYRVVLTRRIDHFIPLRKRVTAARLAKADLFISLHADSIKNHSVRGATIYTLSENASDKEAAQLAERENKADIISGLDLTSETPEVTDILIDLVQRETMNQSARFAGQLVEELDAKVQTHRRPHKFAGFAVLKALDVPSILLEMGYLSNLNDEQLLNTERFRERLASALLRGLDKYFFSGEIDKK